MTHFGHLNLGMVAVQRDFSTHSGGRKSLL